MFRYIEMKNYLQSKRVVLFLFSCIFLAFGMWMIWKLSFIAIDGMRYFSVSDDALITFRYGWNLGHGNGMVWNRGERIEGVTTLLWTIYSAILSIFLPKRIIPFAAQITGIFCILGTGFVFSQMINYLSRDHKKNLVFLNEVLAFLIPLSYYPLIYWSARAMETGLQALLVSLAVWLYVRNNKNDSLLGTLFLGLTYLTRPDNIIPAIILFLFRGYYVYKRKLSIKTFAKELALYFCILLCSMSFRFIYFGEVVPNTYQLKVNGMSIIERIQLNGIGYIAPFVQLSVPIFLIVIISLLIRPNYYKFMFVALSCASVLYVIFIGGDAFPLWRFNSPFMPYIFMIILLDLPSFIGGLSEFLEGKSFAKQRLLSIIIVFSGITLGVSRPPFSSYFVQHPQPDDIENVNKAILLNKILEPSASVGVFYAGAIPYYTDFYAIDFLGKSDPIIADLKPDISGVISWNNMVSVPGHNKYDLVYSIMEKKPTYIAGMKYGSQDLTKQLLSSYIPVNLNIKLNTSSEDTLLLRKDSKDVKWLELAKSVEFNNKIFSIDPSLNESIDVSEECFADWDIEMGDDNYFLWLGEGIEEGFRGLIWSQQEISAQLVFKFVPGPSREDQLRHVEISYRGLASNEKKPFVKILQFDRSAEFVMDVKINTGLNELLISALDRATIETLSSGDTRRLLVQLQNINLIPVK